MNLGSVRTLKGSQDSKVLSFSRSCFLILRQTVKYSNYIYPLKSGFYFVLVCVLCGSQNKQSLFSYTTLTDWFL